MTSLISRSSPALNQTGTHIRPAFLQKEIDFPLCLSRIANLTQANLYLSCNEVGQDEVIRSLKDKNPLNNTVHFGFACEFNYNIIAIRKPRYAFICDIDPKMHVIYAIFRELMLEHPSLDTFKTSLQGLFKEYCITSTTCKLLEAEELLQHFSREDAFLSNQESYEHVRHMYQANTIFHLNLDITQNDDPNTFQSIKRWIDDRNCVVDTLYTSNIVEWLSLKDQQYNYRHNMGYLMCPGKTSFIYAKRKQDPSQPTQILTDKIPQEYIGLPPRRAKRKRDLSHLKQRTVAKKLSFTE